MTVSIELVYDGSTDGGTFFGTCKRYPTKQVVSMECERMLNRSKTLGMAAVLFCCRN